MLTFRIIPILLLQNQRLIKTIKFKNPKYIGDPINAVRIFNEKETDELILLNIYASKISSEPNYIELENIVSEAFMPIGYGGGINSLNQMEKLFRLGIEKIILNAALYYDKNLVLQACKTFGSQSIVASVDVKVGIFGKKKICIHSGTKTIDNFTPDYFKKIEDLGVGEIILSSIDRDGTMTGYDLSMIKIVSEIVSIPVIANSGAGNLKDLKLAIENGASAVAASSLFLYQGSNHAVLINYPKISLMKI